MALAQNFDSSISVEVELRETFFGLRFGEDAVFLSHERSVVNLKDPGLSIRMHPNPVK